MVKNKEEIVQKISGNRREIRALGVKQVGLFGSFVRGEQGSESDVDLVLDFEPGKKTYRNFIRMAELSEELMGREVEVVTLQGLSQFIRPYIEAEVEYVQIN